MTARHRTQYCELDNYGTVCNLQTVVTVQVLGNYRISTVSYHAFIQILLCYHDKYIVNNVWSAAGYSTLLSNAGRAQPYRLVNRTTSLTVDHYIGEHSWG